MKIIRTNNQYILFFLSGISLKWYIDKTKTLRRNMLTFMRKERLQLWVWINALRCKLIWTDVKSLKVKASASDDSSCTCLCDHKAGGSCGWWFIAKVIDFNVMLIWFFFISSTFQMFFFSSSNHYISCFYTPVCYLCFTSSASFLFISICQRFIYFNSI